MRKKLKICKLYCLIIFSFICYIYYKNKNFLENDLDLQSKKWQKKFQNPKCNPFSSNYNQYKVTIDKEVYPKQLTLHLNKSINFTCLNRKQNIKTILLWNSFFLDSFGFGSIRPFVENNCPVIKCKLTNNRSELKESDAVILHGTQFGSIPNIKNRPANQRWIYSIYESPYHLKEILAHLTLPKLNGFFNLSSTYRYNSDFPDFYFNYEYPFYWVKNEDFNENKDFLSEKTHFGVAIISNCGAGSKRLEFLKELRSYVKIDIYGKCGNLNCPKDKDCREFVASKYKFYFAFENSICKDYVTEKFFLILKYNIIPVVFGGADYSYYVPKSGYINAIDFKTPKRLANHLNYLVTNTNAYNSYFLWKKHIKFIDKYSKSWIFCNICIHLHLEDFTGIKYKTLSDLDEFFNVDSNCSGNKTTILKKIIAKEYFKQIYS